MNLLLSELLMSKINQHPPPDQSELGIQLSGINIYFDIASPIAYDVTEKSQNVKTFVLRKDFLDCSLGQHMAVVREV